MTPAAFWITRWRNSQCGRPPRTSLPENACIPTTSATLRNMKRTEGETSTKLACPKKNKIVIAAAKAVAYAMKNDVVLTTAPAKTADRSEEHTSELQSHSDLVCRLLL